MDIERAKAIRGRDPADWRYHRGLLACGAPVVFRGPTFPGDRVHGHAILALENPRMLTRRATADASVLSKADGRVSQRIGCSLEVLSAAFSFRINEEEQAFCSSIANHTTFPLDIQVHT